MVWEAIAAAAVGLAALAMVVEPLLRLREPSPALFDPVQPEVTQTGAALAALKEIEFDRATGKLSEADYQSLIAAYTSRALEALRGETDRQPAPDNIDALVALDAVFCSTCAAALGGGTPCDRCGAAIPPGGRFCKHCGSRVAA